MTRIVPMKNIDAEWTRVSKSDPCPICGANTNCEVFSDRRFASCNGRPSDWPLTNGAWLHRVDDTPADSAVLDDAGAMREPSLGTGT